MDNHIRGLKVDTFRNVVGDFNIAFVAAFIIAMRWVSTTLPFSPSEDFSIVGDIPPSGVFKPTEDASTQGPEILPRHYHKEESSIAGRGTSKEREFLVEACEKDCGKGFGSHVCTREDMDRHLGRNNWLANPRFCITQASGKKGPIDDAARSKFNEMSRILEKFAFCIAIQQCIVARAMIIVASDAGYPPESLPLLSGGRRFS